MLDGDGASPVELPVATAPPLDRSRVWTVGNSDGGKPHDLCHSPHFLYIWHYATGPTSHLLGWASPIRTLGQLVEINTNTKEW